MALIYTKGDAVELFKRDSHSALAHGCNCFCKMRRGIAKQISETYPEVVVSDNKTEVGNREKLGHFSKAYTKGGVIFNIYSQFTYWDENDMLSLKGLGTGMISVLLDIRKTNETLISPIRTLYIPKIGAGLAKGDWNEISEILEMISDAFVDIEIVVVEYESKSESSKE